MAELSPGSVHIKLSLLQPHHYHMVSYPNGCYNPECPDLRKEQKPAATRAVDALQSKLDLVLEELGKHQPITIASRYYQCNTCSLLGPDSCCFAQLRKILETP